jgi:hypothetical protein
MAYDSDRRAVVLMGGVWVPFEDDVWYLYPDADDDDVRDDCDNCLSTPNPDQINSDDDEFGDACDEDDDNDGVLDADDNCPLAADPTQQDRDSDGLGDVCDACPDTLPGAEIGPDGCVVDLPGDCDHDGDVDQEDFGFFQSCLSGSGNVQDAPECEAALLDDDLDVDQDDFGIFQACISGPNVLADPACAD